MVGIEHGRGQHRQLAVAGEVFDSSDTVSVQSLGAFQFTFDGRTDLVGKLLSLSIGRIGPAGFKGRFWKIDLVSFLDVFAHVPEEVRQLKRFT